MHTVQIQWAILTWKKGYCRNDVAMSLKNKGIKLTVTKRHLLWWKNEITNGWSFYILQVYVNEAFNKCVPLSSTLDNSKQCQFISCDWSALIQSISLNLCSPSCGGESAMERKMSTFNLYIGKNYMYLQRKSLLLTFKQFFYLFHFIFDIVIQLIKAFLYFKFSFSHLILSFGLKFNKS